jgi:hypothetical protein
MPQFASLLTFLGNNEGQIFLIFKKHAFFHHPTDLSFANLLWLWLVILPVFAVVARTRTPANADLCSYAAALTAI